MRDDPRNGQAHLRLGYARLQAGDCARAEPEFHAAAASRPAVRGRLSSASPPASASAATWPAPSARWTRRAGSSRTTRSVAANLGILQAAKGNLPAAIQTLNAALAADPNLHEARFNLALAYAKAGRRAEAAAAARELLARLPPGAPQRPEVERLLRAVQ